MKRAIVYARVSTSEQEKGYSLPTQLERCREAAARLDYSVVGAFSEDKSGTLLERAELEKVRGLLKQGQADALFVYTVDRLSRELSHLLLLDSEFSKQGTALYFVSEGRWLGQTINDNLPIYMMALFGAAEREKILERSARGTRGKIESGKWNGQGMAPYGYRKVGLGRDARLEIEPETAAVVRDIFTWYVYGCEDGRGPLGTNEIARRLTALGVPTPSERAGMRGRNTNYQPYEGWRATPITALLRRSAYSGVFYHYNYENSGGKRQRRKISDKEGRVPVPVPAIVDKSLFDAAQRKLDSGKEQSRRGTRNEYLIARRIKCACGYALQARSGALVTGKTYRYTYYKCCSKSERRGDCKVKPFAAARLDQMVWDWLKSTWMDEDRLRTELAAQAGAAGTKQASLERDRQGYAEQLAKLVQKRNNYQEQAAEGLMTLAELRDKLATNTQMAENVKAALQEVEEKLSELTVAADVDGACAVARALRDNLQELERSFSRRRQTIEMLNVRAELIWEGNELVLWVGSAFRPNNERLAVIPTHQPFDGYYNTPSGVV